jgi:hypothetical protein
MQSQSPMPHRSTDVDDLNRREPSSSTGALRISFNSTRANCLSCESQPNARRSSAWKMADGTTQCVVFRRLPYPPKEVTREPQSPLYLRRYNLWHIRMGQPRCGEPLPLQAKVIEGAGESPSRQIELEYDVKSQLDLPAVYLRTGHLAEPKA